MITSKAQLIKQLKNDKNSLEFETVAHFRNELIGVIRIVGDSGTVQSNAFTLSTVRPNGDTVDSWLYMNEFEVNNGYITYKKEIEGVKFSYKIIEKGRK